MTTSRKPSKTAKERFKIGDRVRFTNEAREHGLTDGSRRHSTTGTVRGFGRQPYLVRVQRDGTKYATAYHQDFWKRIAGAPS